MKNFYITTPIYYVNSNPHLGHAYTTILADSLTRFHALTGSEAFMLTGTDEHGDKIFQAAEERGLTPKAFADEISQKFKTLWDKLGLKYNRFIRTTDVEHIAKVQSFLQKIYDNGDIYFGEYGGHYCYGCERFYTEKELEGDLCPQHQTKPEYISEKNYFFRMSKYQGWLKEHILANPDFIRPERYRNEVLSLLESGALEDLCISRPKTRLSWGIDLPFDTNYVCYVWFDALLNYISGIDWPDGELFEKFWPGEHLVAKDILKPHAIFWPTMLKAAGVPPYAHLNVHGYWLMRDSKMSKSLGNVVSPEHIASICGIDSFRYFLLREMHFGSDASFSIESLVTRHNADLANDLGNLFSRVLSMNKKYFNGIVPERASMLSQDERIKELAKSAQESFIKEFANVKFSNALEHLWELVRALNKYVDTEAPWTLYKNNDLKRLGTVMHVLLTGMLKLATQLLPVMPEAAENMLTQLGANTQLATINLQKTADNFNGPEAGTAIAPSSSLFPRLEEEMFEKILKETEKETKATSPAAAPEPARKNPATEPSPLPEGIISFEDFAKIDIRTGEILVAEKVPNADKLLRLEVNIGEERPRQILAGIAEFYEPNALIGRQVCVVANLAPRKMRGLDSEGMLLAVKGDKRLELVTTSAPVPSGSRVS